MSLFHSFIRTFGGGRFVPPSIVPSSITMQVRGYNPVSLIDFNRVRLMARANMEQLRVRSRRWKTRVEALSRFRLTRYRFFH